ncbi:MAG: ABC transporter permease [Candidatus Limnocylindrales bacterium]
MSAAATTPAASGGSRAVIVRFLRRNGWVLTLLGVLALMFAFTKIIQPDYGMAGVSILVLAALPYAFATAGQSIAIIAGGIDLSMAAMMALLGVTAAALMDGQDQAFGVEAVVVVLALGLAVGAINGLSVVITRVPDIVVTLAFFFIWEGAALMVMDAPGGGASTWLRELIIGPIGGTHLPNEISRYLPRALVLLVVALAIVWIPLRRSKLGLAMYAIGSDKRAAHRSGVAVDRTKVASYALAGLFAAMGGLVITMNTGIGNPVQGPYLLASVAAAVLGGVALSGGRGGLVGPIIAVFILRLARQDLTLLSVDPNAAQVIEGLIMVIVVLVGATVALRGRRS